MVNEIRGHRELGDRPAWCSCRVGAKHLQWHISWDGLTEDKDNWEPAEPMMSVPVFKEYNETVKLWEHAKLQARCERKADKAARKVLEK